MIRRQSAIRGFTLLELLIAMMMLVIVLTTLYGSYRSTLSRNPEIENEIRFRETARVTLNQMLADLGAYYVVPSGEYQPPQTTDTSNPYCFISENQTIGRKTFPRLAFPSFYQLKLGDKRQEMVRIVYYVQQSVDGGLVLRRSETSYPYRPFKENAADPVLCSGMRSLQFSFYDIKGNEFHDWNSDSADFNHQTPVAMHIRLELDSATGAMVTGLVFPAFRADNASHAAS